MPYAVGTRYQCEQCGTRALVAKESEEGELRCCDRPMELEKPKKLASSD